MTSVLIVDDEPSIVESLRILFRGEGFTVHTAVGGRAGLERLSEAHPDVVVSDVRMPGVDGLAVLDAARALAPAPTVVLMTAQATLQSAIGAVNAGAFHYLQKPFRNDELVAVVRRAAERGAAERGPVERGGERRGGGEATARRRERGMVPPVPLGDSRAWRDAIRLAETVADSASTVLVTGESGTGKEVVARYLHDRSSRAAGPFLSVNCGALPESLLESELFGHVRGSFTGAVKDRQGLFAAAEGGTFFLDEIGETTPATQVKLLRVLQQREVIPVGASEAVPVDARLVAATNRDLEDEVKRGRFRGDLYYRLNVIAVHLPPLRERPGDVALLADAFLARAATRGGAALKGLAPAARDAMMAYAWPGNVRELENAVERAVLLTPGPVIGAEALPERVTARKAEPLVSERAPASPTLEAIERAYIGWVLRNEGGNKSRAAEVLGIDPSTLYRKLARYGEVVA
jgi:two-component system response regulator HydG